MDPSADTDVLATRDKVREERDPDVDPAPAGTAAESTPEPVPTYQGHLDPIDQSNLSDEEGPIKKKQRKNKNVKIN